MQYLIVLLSMQILAAAKKYRKNSFLAHLLVLFARKIGFFVR